MEALSPSLVNEYIKVLLEKNLYLSNIYIKGEVSNFKLAYSGHMYFSLKDDKSAISCVIFKGNAQNITEEIKDGSEIILLGKIGLYEKSGAYQVYGREVIFTGIGNLYKELEFLKKKLLSEGLFDRSHKRKIPKDIRNVGIVTSLKGAALVDIIKVIKTRNKFINIVIYPCSVQGADSSRSIVQGIEGLNNYNIYLEDNDLDLQDKIDIMIIGRGGGSFEDLFSFNSENVVRSIYDSVIPVVSCVGHEVDVLLSDLVADLRGATPSQGAELITVNINEEVASLKNRLKIQYKKIMDKYNFRKVDFDNLSIKLKKYIFKYKELRVLVNDLVSKLNTLEEEKLRQKRELLNTYKGKLDILNPLSLLAKGYSLSVDKNGKLLKSKNDFKVNQEFILRGEDYEVVAEVKEILDI